EDVFHLHLPLGRQLRDLGFRQHGPGGLVDLVRLDAGSDAEGRDRLQRGDGRADGLGGVPVARRQQRRGQGGGDQGAAGGRQNSPSPSWGGTAGRQPGPGGEV